MAVYLDVMVKARPFIRGHWIKGCWRTVFIVIIGAVSLSACATTAPQGPQLPVPGFPSPGQQPVITKPDPEQPTPKEPTEEPKPEATVRGLTPAFMDGENIRRVALLLPFSARSSNLRAEAASMLQAAEMSVFDKDDNNILLIALDSKGTAQGAAAAAKQAIDQGADVIIGPILAASVKASGLAARASGVPVIGFSTDTSVAGSGVYLLSFPPEAEVSRITKFAAEAGASKFAFLGPESIYGKRVLNAYKANVKNLDGIMAGVETYMGKDITVMQAPAAKLANLFPSPAETAENPEFDDPYHVVLLPEGGTALRSLAPLLTFYNENTRHVQIMGTGLWNRDEAAQEPALAGGIFAGPDLEGKLVFNANYDAVYGEEPSRLASLAYDGLSIASFVAGGDVKDRSDMLTDPAGFFGVDGLVRFTKFGTPERGLAVYQIKNGRFVVIDAAPKSTDGAF
ncbi:MAG: penicillin-binding protein activator [Robiginitomaculum sp.]|nr:penicillin-binding protein activator [Robiginitomaculum sp.]